MHGNKKMKTSTDTNEEEQAHCSDPFLALIAMHATKEFSVDVNKFVFINAEVTLSSNLQVRTIKSMSDAVYSLLIDDQILSINGKVANNSNEVLDMVRESIENEVEIRVNRQSNKSPALPARLILQESEEGFRRLEGAQYFVIKLNKVVGFHLGFKVKSYRGRIIVTEVQENGVASFNYRVGDSILDVNSELVKEVDVFHKKLKMSMHRYRSCTTLVERPTSVTEISNAKVIIDVLAKSKTDPPLPKDVIAIGQREAERFMANLHKNRKLRSIMQKKKKNKKRHSLFIAKLEEEKIGTDVKNPLFLQKIPKHKPPASSLTFLPRFFQ